MMRKLFLLVQLALLGMFVFWLFKNPGQMSVHWFGMRLEMEVSTFVLAALMALGLVGLTFVILRRLFKIPANLFQSFSSLNNNKGVKAFHEALQDFFCDDFEGCLAHLKKTSHLDKEKSVCQILEAHCYLKLGQNLKAEHVFYGLSQEPDTQKGGLMGLFFSAAAQKDDLRLWEYTRAAFEVAPQHPQILHALYTHSLEKENWMQALEALSLQIRLGFITQKQGLERKAHVYLKQAQAALAQAQTRDALLASEQAFDIHPCIQNARVLVPLLLTFEHPKRAKKALRTALAQDFDASLFDELVRLEGLTTPAQRFALMEELAIQSSPITQKYLQALIKEGISCHLWGQTKHYLSLYEKNIGEDVFFSIATAQLIYQESGDDKGALMLYEKAFPLI